MFNVETLNNIDTRTLPKTYQITDEKQADAILLRSEKLHDRKFNPDVAYIGRAGAGVNNIPLDRCSEEGIVVCNAPGANANGVKELVLMSMILASRNVLDAIEWTKGLKGQDNIASKVETGKKNFVGHELRGKKIGVVGLGSIGGRVANMCVSLGMTVYGFDPFVTLRSAWGVDSRVIYTEDKETLFTECDFVSIHIPFTKDNENIIDADTLALAKEGLTLINMARDGLVDLNALKPLLESGKIAQYIVDFPEEATLNMPNTINIPHLGASTPESQANAAQMVIQQMDDFLKNGNITNSVNYPDVSLGVCKTAGRVTLCHKNIPNMLTQILATMTNRDFNIANMANKHKNGWAYTIVDTDNEIDNTLIKELKAIDGVVRVRQIK